MSAVIILTYGKVCSSSLRQMLIGQFPDDVYYSHGLRSSMPRLVRSMMQDGLSADARLAAGFSDNDAIERRLEIAARDGETVTIVTGVREPVARSLSIAMQTLPLLHADLVSSDPGITAENVAERLRDLWISDRPIDDIRQKLAAATVRAPFDWFREEIEEPFGFDLHAESFDLQRGYKLLTSGNINLLVFRMENAPDAIEAGLSALFPERTFVLPKINITRDKPDYPVYRELQGRFTLPEAVLDGIYENRYVRAFLSDEEIRRAKARWSTAPSRLRAPPRATVVMAVLNHERWVGRQLESLFAQWRPDLALLVIDDGSTDRSTAAIAEVLVAHPEVRATVLRNGRPLAAKVLDQFLAFTESPILIQADSDDVSLPGRLDAILERFDADPRCRLVTSNAVKTSAEGTALGLSDVSHGDEIADDPSVAASRLVDLRWTGATAAYHRSLLADFPLEADLSGYAIDLLLPLRAALTGTHHYIAEPLVEWRQHPYNTHRTAYGADRDDAAIEKRLGVELMLLAQKIRDVERARADRPDLQPAAAQAWNLFFSHFSLWGRARSRIAAAGADAPRTEARLPAAPPVATLRCGVRQTFGADSLLGSVASAWDGFYPPEASWIWTSRWAVIAFRAPDAAMLRIGLGGASWSQGQDVRLRVSNGAWVHVPVTEGEIVVSLHVTATSSSGILTLTIEATGAGRPADRVPGFPDERLLGIRLNWIEAL